MRSLLAILIMGAWLGGVSHADRVTLTNPEPSPVPPAQKLNWYVSLIDATSKTLIVRYQRLDTDGVPLAREEQWVCRDIEVSGANAECTDVAVPEPCCTGAGTGTCDGLEDNCFSSIFRFTIRAQDVGQPIGVGLRTLIFNQMRQDILTSGNNGTFED